jgi:hypothetical protein
MFPTDSNLFEWIVCCSSNERFTIFLLLRCSRNGIGEKHIAEILRIFSPKYLHSLCLDHPATLIVGTIQKMIPTTMCTVQEKLVSLKYCVILSIWHSAGFFPLCNLVWQCSEFKTWTRITVFRLLKLNNSKAYIIFWTDYINFLFNTGHPWNSPELCK